VCDWSADGNYVQAFSEEQRRSRKARKCSTCGGRIKEGERYVRFFWVHDGDACSSSQCLFCNVAYEAFRSEHREYPMPNELWSGLIECLDGVNKREPEAVAWRNALAGMKRRERVATRAEALP